MFVRYAPSVNLILRVDVDSAFHQSLHLVNVSDGTGLSQTLLQLFIQRCRWHYSSLSAINKSFIRTDTLCFWDGKQKMDRQLAPSWIKQLPVVGDFWPRGGEGVFRRIYNEITPMGKTVIDRVVFKPSFADYCNPLVSAAAPPMLGAMFGVTHSDRDLWFRLAHNGKS